MPITFHFRPEVKLVISVHVGTTPDDEFIASYKSLYENDLFDTSMNRLMDLRQADTPQIGTDVLRQFAELVREQFKENGTNPKVAVVATRELFFDLARMYEIFTGVVPLDIAIFHSAEEALAWFGLPEDFMDDLDKDIRQ
jgi:hypothetical protein